MEPASGRRTTYCDRTVVGPPSILSIGFYGSNCRTEPMIRELPDMMSASEEGGGLWKSGHSKEGCVNFIV